MTRVTLSQKMSHIRQVPCGEAGSCDCRPTKACKDNNLLTVRHTQRMFFIDTYKQLHVSANKIAIMGLYT
jgi:hypothetical protein